MAICPRCRQELVENQVDEFAVRLCVPCKGVFVRHADIVQILERSWRVVSREEAERAQFHAPANWLEEQRLHCPHCSAVMEKYGYMGLAAIQIDRCERCESVWLDADELPNMVLALARTNYRSEKAQRREWEDSQDIASVGMRSFAGARVEFDPNVAGGVVAVTALLRLLR